MGLSDKFKHLLEIFQNKGKPIQLAELSIWEIHQERNILSTSPALGLVFCRRQAHSLLSTDRTYGLRPIWGVAENNSREKTQ